MLASKITDVINADIADNSSLPALDCLSSVPCSICFDLVIDNGERSIAKLQCGHKFHLDCIGSAFNMKGSMQCPNCRKVESGRWLFAGAFAHAISETGALDWMPNEGPNDLRYSRRPFGFHWCPFSGFTLHSSFEEAESSLNTSTNLHGNHAMITERTYFRPSEHFGNSNFHHPFNSFFAPRSNNIHHPSWGWTCHFLPYNADRDYFDHAQAHADAVARSHSSLHPLHYSQQPISRTGESSVPNSQSSEITSMPSSTSGFRRFGGVRRLPMTPSPVLSRSRNRGGHGHGFYILETERDESPYVPMMRRSFHPRFSTNRTY